MAIKTIRVIPWRGKKPDKTLRGKALMPSATVAERYETRLRPVIYRMLEITEEEIGKLFQKSYVKEFFAQDASVASQARILMNALARRFDDLFGLRALKIAENFAVESDKSSASALKISLKELSQGMTLKTDIFTGELDEIISATVTENVALIKSIPEQYLNGVHGAVMRSITTGNGLADLVPFLKKHDEITTKRARLIAHDQTRKAFSNINRVRMEKLGVKKFEWLHSAGGQTPRPLHVEMSGNIYSFDDPPVIDDRSGERGFPGQLINCRCRMIPVVSFDEE